MLHHVTFKVRVLQLVDQQSHISLIIFFTSLSSFIENILCFPWCIDLYKKLIFFSDIEYPEQRKLRFVEKAPLPPPGQKNKPTTKNLIDIRGPELKENYLIHKQYGIRVCI